MFEVRSHALDMYIFHVKIESLPTCETIVQYKYSALHNTHSPALPVPHPQYNVNTILHMSAEDSEDSEGSEVSSPLQNIGCMGNLFARLLGDGAAEVEKNTPFPVTEFLTL